eukprot:4323336-Prymnesium_polylepis.1
MYQQRTNVKTGGLRPTSICRHLDARAPLLATYLTNHPQPSSVARSAPLRSTRGGGTERNRNAPINTLCAGSQPALVHCLCKGAWQGPVLRARSGGNYYYYRRCSPRVPPPSLRSPCIPGHPPPVPEYPVPTGQLSPGLPGCQQK